MGWVSVGWRKYYNPHLCFFNRNQSDKPLPSYRKLLNKFPSSQHRPVVLVMKEVELNIHNISAILGRDIEALLKRYQDTGDQVIEGHVIESLNSARAPR